MTTVLTPLSTKASPGNVVLSSNQHKENGMKKQDTNNYGTPMTPCRKRSQHTPRPMWSLPRAHFACADSPSLDSDDSDDENEKEEEHKLGDELQLALINDENKENFQVIVYSQQLEANKQTTEQSLEKPVANVADITKEQQPNTQQCGDSINENIDCDNLSAVSVCQAAPNNGSVPILSSDARTDLNFAMEQLEIEPSPDNSTSTDNNNEEGDTLSPLPQRAIVVRSPAPSLAPSKTETTSIAASSAVTDLFAALRSTCSTEYGEENDNDINRSEAQLSPIHPQQSCLTAERKRWIHKTLLSKREYTPYQTKEREECCKNKDSHELTSVRKRWIEETLLTPAREDVLRKMSPKETHSSFNATALAETGQIRWEDDEDPFFSEGGDESTVASQMKSPNQCQTLDNSFLASALVATNMLLTPPRREHYSSKPSRPRMSIGATPLPFAAPFSPSSAASSAFTEAASNIILNAIKQLSPASSVNRSRNQQGQQSITPTRKSDLLSIVEKMDYLDKVNTWDSKDGDRSKLHLEERVEKLEQLINQQSNRTRDDLQEKEINKLRHELQRSHLLLQKERQLVEEAEKRVSMLMLTLTTSQETHNDVERLLKERIQNLELEVECLQQSQKQVEGKAGEEDCSLSPRVEEDTLQLDSLRKENNELQEMYKNAELNHLQCAKENEDLRSQLQSVSNDRVEKEQMLASALDNLRQASESFSDTKQQLEHDVNAKTNEVKCMQRSLDLMSCELIESTNEVLELRTENARLQEELRHMKASKRWLFS